ncbi:MAG: hypothetical protein ACLSG0_03410, partial [Oscillibacter sp.]
SCLRNQKSPETGRFQDFFSNLLAVIRKRKITLSNTFLTHSGKRLFLGTKSNHNRKSNAPKIKMISGAVFRSDDGGIWP